MPKGKEFRVTVEDRPGALASRCLAMAEHGVNILACMCAIDKASLTPLLEYWVPGVEVGGVHEFVGNALVMKGESRTTDLRGEPL